MRQLEYPAISICDTTLTCVDKQKYLGTMFDRGLSWIHQVSDSCRKTLLLSLSHQRTHTLLKCQIDKFLIESLFFSHLSYCLPVGVRLSLSNFKEAGEDAESSSKAL